MRRMRFYINSCGQSLPQGYMWVEVTESGIQPATPPFLSQMRNFVYEEDFSLFLAYFSEEIVLQVTGLKGRQEKHKILPTQNTLLCIGEAKSLIDKQLIRVIVIAALQANNPLESIVRDAVRFDESEIGFHVESSLRECLSLQGLSTFSISTHDSQPAEKESRMEIDSKEERERIVAELSTHSLPEESALPDEQLRLLIIITKVVMNFEATTAWRCLAEEKLSVEKPPSKPASRLNEFLGWTRKYIKKLSPQKTPSQLGQEKNPRSFNSIFHKPLNRLRSTIYA